MNWTQERSSENLCGYCNGSPPSNQCDGCCFNLAFVGSPDKLHQHKLQHVMTQMRETDQQFAQLLQRKKDLRQEMTELDPTYQPTLPVEVEHVVRMMERERERLLQQNVTTQTSRENLHRLMRVSRLTSAVGLLMELLEKK